VRANWEGNRIMTMLITTAEVVKRLLQIKPFLQVYYSVLLGETNRVFRHLPTLASSKIKKGLDGLYGYRIGLRNRYSW
jgi:hypothetical protein